MSTNLKSHLYWGLGPAFMLCLLCVSIPLPSFKEMLGIAYVLAMASFLLVTPFWLGHQHRKESSSK